MLGINTYRKRKMLEVDKEVFEYRSKLIKEVEEIAIKCARQLGEYEHEFHHTKEEKGIELAKLDALIEIRKNDEATYERLLKERNEEVVRLNTICLKLAENKGVIVQK
jgi:hypothetical protein